MKISVTSHHSFKEKVLNAITANLCPVGDVVVYGTTSTRVEFNFSVAGFVTCEDVQQALAGFRISSILITPDAGVDGLSVTDKEFLKMLDLARHLDKDQISMLLGVLAANVEKRALNEKEFIPGTDWDRVKDRLEVSASILSKL